jgi:threonine/homoserine/homoserine lactone efflux protein
MVSLVIVFLLVSFISFVGSLQLGLVNVAVIRTVVYQNFNAALWVALGGCLPEMFYSVLAIFFSNFIESSFFYYLKILVCPILLTIGIFNLFQKNKGFVVQEKRKHSKSFLLGFGLAMLNPQLIVFWFIILVYLKTFNGLFMDQIDHQIAFVLGTSAGAYVLLYVFAYLIHKNQQWIYFLQKWNFNRITGWIFVFLAILQLIQLIWKNEISIH